MAQGMNISISSRGHQSKCRPQAGKRERKQLNVIYHILAPWWPMWKELANPHIALHFKKHLHIYPSSHNSGENKTPTTTQHSCMVPVGTAVKACTFFSGSWTKKDYICCSREQHSPGRDRRRMFFSPQAFSHFLSCSPSWSVSAGVPRKIYGLLNSKGAANKGWLQLAKKMEYFA